MSIEQKPEVIFANLKSTNQPFVIESMCVQCGGNGKTTMLLANIPFFRQIVVVAFECEECGNRNSQIQFGGQLADQGLRLKFKVLSIEDLNRQQLVKSQHATIKIPELQFEIPCNKKGQISTIEGIISRCIDDISKEQPIRKVMDQSLYSKLEDFLTKLNLLKTPQGLPFTIYIEDPSGLSFIKNPQAPKIDPQMHIELYNRTVEQIEAMGYSVDNAKQIVKQQNEQKKQNQQISHKIDFTKAFDAKDILKKEGIAFEVQCHACGLMGQTKMCQVSIPYFKDLIIMSFSCDKCGAHSTQTKTSGQIGDHGAKFTIKNPDQQDLKRDVFKSDTCGVQIPQLELQLNYGTLGGVYTTVQGLLQKIYDNLNDNNPFVDSDAKFGSRMEKLLNELTQCRNGERPFTLILDDPLAHSFIQNPNHPNPDTKVIIEIYQRNEEQNDILGISDMKVQNY